MFKTINPYDEVIAKATAETQTDENWDVYLTVWDKVNEDGEAGARSCVSALQRRLQHRNANVQLFSLTLADALVSNCGPPLHREICGKAFTQTLVKLVNDRTTHEGVKKRILTIINGWVRDHRKDPDFDLMVETYESLRAQNHKFEDDQPQSPTGPSDDVLRREEEELQRALRESAALADPLKGFQPSQKALPQSPVDGGFVPPASSSVIAPPSRVRALYDFDTPTPGELAFRQGEVIKVLGREHDNWWTGELKGKQGIFPVVYVEEILDSPPTPPPVQSPYINQQYQQPYQHTQQAPLPMPTASSPAPVDEGEVEAQLFAQAASIDKLLHMMKNLDPHSENLSQNEELLDLYQQSMALRPKVVKLIEKYNRKQAELGAINEKFSKAASTYDRMVAESQQRHNPLAPYQNGYGGGYDQGYAQQPPPHQYQQQPSSQAQLHPQPLNYQQAAAERPDPRALAGLSEQQRREYEQQWAVYEQQLAQYQAQQAAYYASQGQQMPPQTQATTQGQAPSQQPPPTQQHYDPHQGAAQMYDRRQSYSQPQQGPLPAPAAEQAPGYYPPARQDPSHGYPHSAPAPSASQLPAHTQPPAQGPPSQTYNAAPQSYSQPPATTEPPPSPYSAPVAASIDVAASTQVQAQPPPQAQIQPVWDGAAWVWPTQQPPLDPATGAQAYSQQYEQTAPAPTPAPVPVPAQSPPLAGVTMQAYPASANPYPVSSHPPSQAQPVHHPSASPPPAAQGVSSYGGPAYQLSDSMQALSINPVPTPATATGPSPQSPPPAQHRTQSPPVGYPQQNAAVAGQQPQYYQPFPPATSQDPATAAWAYAQPNEYSHGGDAYRAAAAGFQPGSTGAPGR